MGKNIDSNLTGSYLETRSSLTLTEKQCMELVCNARHYSVVTFLVNILHPLRGAPGMQDEVQQVAAWAYMEPLS